MKTKLLNIGLVIVIAIVAVINVFNSQKSEVLSDVAMANVEALARDESGKDIYCCGNAGTCAKIVGGGEIKGIPFYTPCP